MTRDSDSEKLAPLTELQLILSRIERAKQNNLLGSALFKTTTFANDYRWVPVRLRELSTLLEANTENGEDLCVKLSSTLDAVNKLGENLSGEITIVQLDEANQHQMPQLPLQIEKIVQEIEDSWKRLIQKELGGQAALGEILTSIPGMQNLGDELIKLADRTRLLEVNSKSSDERVTEFRTLVGEASLLNQRLLKAGIKEHIAEKLVKVVANPVPLDEITEEFLQWIRDHDALSLFYVSVGTASDDM
jgi:hypothetical protein